MSDLQVPLSETAARRRSQVRGAYEIDYSMLAQEIIREIRGPLTQRQASERLGYTFNQLGKWESGFTRMKWGDFLRYAPIVGVPVDAHFRHAFWTHSGELTVESTLRTLATHLMSQTGERESGSRAQKWLSGEVVPDLADVLKWIGTRPAMLFGWLSHFVDGRRLPSLQPAYEDFLTRRATVFSNPLSVFVNAALQLQSYRSLPTHDERLLAVHAACRLQDVRRTLASLRAAGLVTFEGGKYHPMENGFSFSGLRDPKLRGLTKRATDLAAERYSLEPVRIDPEHTRTASISSVRVEALSAVASKKIADLISKFQNEVAGIIATDSAPKDNVQVFVLHSFASSINTPMEKVELEI